MAQLKTTTVNGNLTVTDKIYLNNTEEVATKTEVDEKISKISDNLTATVDCSHQYEITGNTGDEHGLAIEDQQMLINKIQGHSRRKSLNLFDINKVNITRTSNCEVSKENNAFVVKVTNQSDPYFFVNNNGFDLIDGKTYYYKVFSEYTSGNTRLDFWGLTSAPLENPFVYKTNEDYHFEIEDFEVGKTYKFYVSISEKPLEIFKPYDNTLVNSNNTLISTGRNILNPDDFGARCSTYDKSTGVATLVAGPEMSGKVLVPGHYFAPKTQYSFIFRGKSSSSIGQYSQIRIVYTDKTYNEPLFNDGLATYVSVPGMTIEKVVGIWADGTTTLYLNECAIIKGADQEFEPYKQDLIQAPMLGEFDYYQEGKIYRQTSQIITLNGSEEWNLNESAPNKQRFVTYPKIQTIDTSSEINLVANNLTPTTTAEIWINTEKNNLIGAQNTRVEIVKREFTTAAQLKQWLAQNPIQLVYKLNTQTIEDYSMPSGYAVYNGGMQIQQGDVPYTITKQYNLSQKSQILANIEIDREQQNQLDAIKNEVNILENDVKNIGEKLALKVECDHAVEITGQTNHEYNLAIEDQQMLITKIQGHTGIKSPNLIQFKSGTYGGVTVSYDSATGIHTFNGTSTGASIPLNQTYPIPQGTKVSFIAEVVSGTKTGAQNDISVMIDGTWIATDWVNNKTLSENIDAFWMSSGIAYTNYKVKINVVEGTYTNDTMPPLKPYDNTLVNSNNTLISTGRNLVDVIIPTMNASEWKYLETTTLLKGRYFVKVESDNNEGACLINIGSFEVYPSGIKYNTAYWFDVKGSGAQGQIQFYSNTANTNVKVQIRYTPTGNVNFDFEPYKEDIIQAPMLGEFDYYQEGKIYRQTSQIVTLNGSENWNYETNNKIPNFYVDLGLSNNANFHNEVICATNSFLKEVSCNNLWSGSDNSIAIGYSSVYLTNTTFTTPDQLKQWLRENPIQLVYKLNTQTIEDYSMPSGYAVYNGGMQIQQGDVPYTITKQYNLSQKSQILANIEIDREQQNQLDAIKNEVNILENDVKNIGEKLALKVECDHAVEITGQTNHEYNLAIEDQQMLINKIQGHSRRKSLNLMQDKNESVGSVQFSISKSVLTINGTTNSDTTWFGIPVDYLPTNFVFSTFNTSAVNDCDILFMRGGTPIDYISNLPKNSVKNISNIESISIRLNGNGKTFSNVKIPIMINEGTTALPFQPYDNTLVNSNNTLISTGRNILNPDEFGARCSTYDKSTGVATLVAGSEISNKILMPSYYFAPKTQYSFIFRGKSSSSIGQYSQIRIVYTDKTYNEPLFNDGLATYVSSPGMTIEKVVGTWADGTTTLYLNECAIIKGANQKFEPYKEDTITSIGSLGEFDYILPQSNQRVRQTSQIITLNGSENWSKGQTINSEHWRFDFIHSFSNVYENLNEVTTTSTWKDVTENQTWGGGVNNFGVSINDKRIYLCNEDFTTVDQLKQWLAQNPIQLVYKLNTPTIEDYAMPSGYAVYNGGMQIQQGDVPYTITKQYNLSQKSQILANIEIDREQAKMIDEKLGKTETAASSNGHIVAEHGNEMNVYGSNTSYAWLNYRGGCSTVKIGNGDGNNGDLGSIEANQFIGTARNAQALENHPASYFATAGHNHDSTYAKLNSSPTFANCTLTGNLYLSSDRRVKENIEKFDGSILDKINSVDIFKYNYKNSDEKQIGVMAQDLEEILPELKDELTITKDDSENTGISDRKFINENKLIYVLWKAVQELSEEVKMLKENNKK